MRLTTLAVLTLGVCGMLSAASVASPEINPAFGSSALALLGGALVVIRSARKR